MLAMMLLLARGASAQDLVSSGDRRLKAPAIPFELANNHVFVPVRVAGEALWFLLDTGAANTLLDLGTARSLSLPLGPSFEARGAGPGSVPGAALAPPAAVHFDNVPELRVDVPAAIDLEGIAAFEGRAVNGILGADFISRFVLEIDYRARLLRLHDRGDFVYPGPGTSLPMTLPTGHPHVDAELILSNGERVSGDFVLDVGSSFAVALARPFVAQHHLAERYRSGPTIQIGRGIGGTVTAQLGRVSGLQLGALTVAAPIVAFAGDGAGVLSTGQFFEGNIGGEVLRRFSVFLDYGGGRVVLEPNEDLTAPFETDMSGAVLKTASQDRSRPIVSDILPASPAAEAGLQVDDVIVAIDGRQPVSLDEIRRDFKEPARRFLLSVERQGRVVSLTLTTRRLV